MVAARSLAFGMAPSGLGVGSYYTALFFMMAFQNILVRVEAVHGELGLRGVFGVRAIVAGTVAPPFELAVIEVGLSGIEHRLTAGDGGMAIRGVHQQLAAHHSAENVLGIGDQEAVLP